MAIGEWVAHQSEQTSNALVVVGSGPAESTTGRAFGRVDGDVLDQVIGAFMWTRTTVVGERRVIAWTAVPATTAATPRTSLRSATMPERRSGRSR